MLFRLPENEALSERFAEKYNAIIERITAHADKNRNRNWFYFRGSGFHLTEIIKTLGDDSDVERYLFNDASPSALEELSFNCWRICDCITMNQRDLIARARVLVDDSGMQLRDLLELAMDAKRREVEIYSRGEWPYRGDPLF